MNERDMVNTLRVNTSRCK